MGKFIIKGSNENGYWFYLTAANGHTLVKSEKYNSKTQVKNAIQSVRKNSYDAPIVEELN